MKRIFLILSLLIGIVILLYPYGSQIITKEIQKRESREFQAYATSMSNEEATVTKTELQKCVDDITMESFDFYDPWNEEGNVDIYSDCVKQFNIANNQGQTKIDKSSVSDMVSVIEIPKLNLFIPIYLGSSEMSLSRGVGIVEGSSLPFGGADTHTVLAGHRGMGTKEMFRNLDKLDAGDVFYLHTLDEVLTYEVYEQEIIKPDDTSSLQIEPDRDLATLLTCHPYRHNYQRLLIHAERKE